MGMSVAAKIQHDKDYEHLCDFLSRAGGTMFTTRCTSKERKRYLLNYGPNLMSGHQIRWKHLGEGIHEVSAREESE